MVIKNMSTGTLLRAALRPGSGWTALGSSCIARGIALGIAMAAANLNAAEVSFEVSKDATLLQGLIVPDSQSLGGGYFGLDFWDEFSHGDIFGPLYAARPDGITGIELAYFDYAPLAVGHRLAPLDVDLTFQTDSASTTLLNLVDTSGAATGTLDLLNSVIGADLKAMLADYRFDPVFGAAEDPVVMGISASDSGFPDLSGAASYRIRITVADAAEIPAPPVVALLGVGAAVWWFLWPWSGHQDRQRNVARPDGFRLRRCQHGNQP